MRVMKVLQGELLERRLPSKPPRASGSPRLPVTPGRIHSTIRTPESFPLRPHHVLSVYDDGLRHVQIRRDDNGDGSCGY
jgi:hypothetical protein